jgi:hypothetical protein
MSYRSAAEAAPNGYPTVENPRQQIPLTIYTDCATIVRERQQIRQDDNAVLPINLPIDEVNTCIVEHGWRFNNPNPFGYPNVTSPENFIDGLARMYLTTSKMKDKFMPTQERLSQYINQLENPDPAQGDAAWRYYTRTNFEYFPQPVFHPVSQRLVHGLYKKLSKKDAELCNKVHSWNLNGVEPANKQRFKVLEAYEKVISCQAQVSPFEESYNIILAAHVERREDNSHNTHHGRDTTYRRATQLSSSITKEVVNRFLQYCPNCAERIEMCSKARDKAIQNQKNIVQEEAIIKAIGREIELGDDSSDDNKIPLAISDRNLPKKKAAPVKGRDNDQFRPSPQTIGHPANRFDDHSQHQHIHPNPAQSPGGLELREPQVYHDPAAAPVKDTSSENSFDSYIEAGCFDPIFMRDCIGAPTDIVWEDISIVAAKIGLSALENPGVQFRPQPNPILALEVDESLFLNQEAQIQQPPNDEQPADLDTQPDYLEDWDVQPDFLKDMDVQPDYLEDLAEDNFSQYLENMDLGDLDMTEF